jgi:hypothetical protein
MRKWTASLVCLALVVALGVGARLMAGSMWRSFTEYQSPYLLRAGAPAGPRLADRVVLVTVDGLRLDTSRSLSFLNQLRARGADGAARVGLPSLSSTGRATLATGAWAEVHAATSNSAARQIEQDSIFSLARDAGLRTLAVGSSLWERGFTPWVDAYLAAPPDDPGRPTPEQVRESEQAECARVRGFLRGAGAAGPGASQDTRFDLLAIDLMAGDAASHNFGSRSLLAQEIYAREDGCLSRFVPLVAFGSTVVIVQADHGHVDRGGHGGDEPEVLNVPLVMAGGPVRSGVSFQAEQVDVAPTICALLGLPLPATSQGRIVLEALRLDEPTAVALRRAQDQQKTRFAAFRAGILGGTLADAQSKARSGRDRIAFLIGAALVGLLAWLFAGLRGRRQRLAVLAALVVFWLTYALLFRLLGLAYSLTAVNKEAYLNGFFLRDMLAGAIALLFAAFCAGMLCSGDLQLATSRATGDQPSRDRKGASPTPHLRAGGRSWGRSLTVAARLSAAVSLLVSVVLAILVLSAWWFDGLWTRAWLPNLRLGFMIYMNLLVMYAVCFAAWLAPLAAWLGGRISKQ